MKTLEYLWENPQYRIEVVQTNNKYLVDVVNKTSMTVELSNIYHNKASAIELAFRLGKEIDKKTRGEQ